MSERNLPGGSPMRFATSRGGGAPGGRGPSLIDGTIDPEVIQLVPRHVAERHGVVPLARDNGALLLAMANPNDVIALDEIRSLTGYSCRPLMFPQEQVRQAIARYYAGEGETTSTPAARLEGEPEEADQVVSIGAGADALEAAPIRLVNQILEAAIAQRVSDIHIEPHDKRTVVRF